MFKIRVQESLDSFDQSSENAYISRFMIAMKVRFMPKSSRLKVLQLFRRKLSLDMLKNTLNQICKVGDRNSELKSKPCHLNIYLHLHVSMFIQP